MNTNILIAIKNIVDKPIVNLVSYYRSTNRINSVGEALEQYIKDAFCNSLNIENQLEKENLFTKYFSYLGNQNNPPDIMITDGDAIEVKKIESINSAIALNSSYPKDKLSIDSPMITAACRNAEEWVEKDMLYTVGFTKENTLSSLWFVYGNCYAANRETYERISNKITLGLNELKDVQLSETKELGRVNKVDPLGITNLRIRAMWHIENPNKVFNNIVSKIGENFNLNAIMLKEKYESFPLKDRQELEKINIDGFTIKDVQVKSPDNPAKLLSAKLISYIK